MEAILIRWAMVLLIGAALYGGGRLRQYGIDQVDYAKLVDGYQKEAEVAAAERAVKVKALLNLNKKVDADAKKQVRALGDTIIALTERLSNGSSSTGIAEAARPTGGADGRVCYDSGSLVAGLQGSVARFSQRLGPIVGEGAKALALMDACRAYVNGFKALEIK